jgi:hypothetical protein
VARHLVFEEMFSIKIKDKTACFQMLINDAKHAHFWIRLKTKHYILQKSGLAYFVSVSKFKQLTSWQHQVIFRTVFLKVREVSFFEAMPILRPI